MSFINKVAAILGVKTIDSPLIKKDIEESTVQLQEMYHLALRCKSPLKKEEILKDMLLFQLGHDGEKIVMYELKNSYIPMIVLHDIRLENSEHSAQIDFIIITHKFIMLLETKKLSGDIEITPEGDFIRSYKINGRGHIKEGIYSPVTQNEKHVELVKEMLINAGLIKQIPVLSLVVIANPKSIIRRGKAPKEISNLIAKADQLKSSIKKRMNEKLEMPEDTMIKIYKYLVEKHTPKQYDLLEKYSIDLNDLKDDVPFPTMEETALFMKSYKKSSFSESKEKEKPEDDKIEETVKPASKHSIDSNHELNNGSWELKKYRLITSKTEGVPPYYIFSDAELEMLVKLRPKTLLELQMIKGFGPKKIEKYGEAILKVLNG